MNMYPNLSRPVIKDRAKQNFKAYYGMTLGIYILGGLLMGFGSAITLGVGVFLLMPPLWVGMCYSFLCIYRGQQPTVNTLFESGFNNYGRVVGGILWMELFIWLWSLLLVIPGIIKGIAYSMTPYLLADHPNIPATEAIKVSNKITYGYKMDIFIMQLSFIGWHFLSILTCGLLELLYVGPYLEISMAGLYEELKQNALSTGRITPADLEGPQQQYYQNNYNAGQTNQF